MSTPTPNATSRADWLFEHILAVLTLGSFVYFYWLMVKLDIDLDVPLEQLQRQLQLPGGILLAGTVSCIAAIWFWYRMFRDFARKRPARHAAAWGFLLVVGAHLTGLVYFVMIWRPRHRPA